MIGIRNEYVRMFEAEHRMWWFKILHQQTLDAIQLKFGSNKSIAILDVGCGTGGMLDFLKNEGYQQIIGFDLSQDAVEFAVSRGLNVSCANLKDIASFAAPQQFDVIICNDILCFFSDTEIVSILQDIRQKLSPNGLMISNNAAFSMLKGAHDIVLQVPRRFVKKEFDQFAALSDFKPKTRYWSALLTPLIFVLRLSQRIALKLQLRQVEHLDSDVDVPIEPINLFLFWLVRFEQKILGNAAPFGSSVFVVLEK
jgi:2-polyprenyl-3-methyl-5-hydroxy-6-metoxy-1,4-benzoquinol methylase